MNTIALQWLRLRNFKKTRDLTVNFQQVTNIFGHNETGKTTLMDAFLWLFFGKDSTGRVDFEIKTLDENNKPYRKLEHEVSALITANGQEITIRRLFEEKWTKKRGSATEEFTGHQTSFFWNDVPLKESEYSQKVASLCQESIFKLITNTSYFNSLKWTERRSTLLLIAGEISNDSIIDQITTVNNKTEISILVNALNQGKSLDEFKKEIAQKKKRIKDELILIPSRIDEANRSLPDPADYEAIKAEIDSKTEDLRQVESQLMDKTTAQKEHQAEVMKKITLRSDKEKKRMQLESSEKEKFQTTANERARKIMDIGRQINDKSYEKDSELKSYNIKIAAIERLNKERDELRKKWEELNNKKLEFDEKEFSCPTCNRPFDEGATEAKKTEMFNNFIKAKTENLKIQTDRGMAIKQEVEDLQKAAELIKSKGLQLGAEIEQLKAEKLHIETQHEEARATEETQVKIAIQENRELEQLNNEIVALTEEIDTPYQTNDKDLLDKRGEINRGINELNLALSKKDLSDKIKNRIKELEDSERAMSVELAQYEGTEFTIEQFVNAKMDTLEKRINARFSFVQFKMFEDQINGGKVEACTTLVKGVPYPDVNTAGKIQAGLDIINVLTDHYQIAGPVWIDNRESVIDLPETKLQLINLFVSEKDLKIRVE